MARVQSEMVKQALGSGIDLRGRRNDSIGSRGEPQVDVIAVGVKILDGMRQSSKRGPGGGGIICQQRWEDQGALLLNIGVGFFKGTSIKMIFIVTDLREQAILIEVGICDFFERLRAEVSTQGKARHLDMVGFKHRSIISEAYPLDRAAILRVSNTLVIMTA